jgi:hypothetical protein
MAITQITNHVARARARLKEQFKDKVKYNTFLDTFSNPSQSLEDALWQLLTERAIDTAIGSQLDNIGAIVGEARGGASDADYRPRLRARIAANRSNGTVRDLNKVTRLILNDGTISFQVLQQPTAAVVMDVDDVLTDTLSDTLISFLRDTKSGGVRILLEYWTNAEPFKTAIFTPLNGAHSIGNTTVTVDSTADFPSSGSIEIDRGLATFETKAYTGKTATTFTGVTALTQNHADNSAVQLARSEDYGWGDDSAAGGGNLATVKE